MTELDRLYQADSPFALFSLPAVYEIDRAALQERYLQLTRLTHPDFANPDDASQVQAQELSARINQAYTLLADDLQRAQYLLDSPSGPAETPDASDADAIPLCPDILEQIFDLREGLTQARMSDDQPQLLQFRQTAQTWQQQLMEQIAAAFAITPLSPPQRQQLRTHLNTARYLTRIVAAAK